MSDIALSLIGFREKSSRSQSEEEDEEAEASPMPGLGNSVAPTENAGFDPIEEREKKDSVGEKVDKLSGLGAQSLSSEDICNDFGLHQAAREGAVEALKQKLDQVVFDGQDILRVIDFADGEGLTPLHHAAKCNRKEAVTLLIENGAFIDKSGEDHNTPLHFAAKYNSVAVARLLVTRGADVNIKNIYGSTALHFAARRGNTEIARLLIDQQNCDVNAKDNALATPLHQAAISGDSEITEELIKRGADVFAVDIDNENPLHFAAEEGSDEVVDVILKSLSGGMDEVDGTPSLTKLDYINRKSGQQDTALHLACTAGYADTVERLISHGADVNLLADGKISPLHMAATSGNISVAKILLRYRAKVNARDDEQMTPLHNASTFGKCEMIEYLLERGAHINSKDKDNYTPLLSAVWKGQTEAGKLLIDKGAKTQVTDSTLKTCLHLAVDNDHTDTLEMLLENGASGLVNTTDKDYKTPLHYAAHEGNFEALQVLLKHDAKADFGDNLEKTPLHYAAEKGKPRCVETLCKCAGNVLNTSDDKGRMPIHLAAINGNIRAVRILVDMGSEIDARDDTAWTPLDYAAKNGFWKSMRILLDNDAPVDAQDKNKNTPLHWAASEGHVECVTMLLDYGADISFRDIQGKNCLDLAVDNFQVDICMALVKHPRWREAMENVANDGSTPMRKLIVVAPDVAQIVMDKCIEESIHTRDHEDFSITYDFRYIDTDPSQRRKGVTCLEPVTMAEYHREKLLSHPLTKRLISLKWARLGRTIYYTTLTLYLLFVACVTSTVVIEREADRNIELDKINRTDAKSTRTYGDSTTFKKIVPGLTVAICIVNIVKEIVQMLFQRKKYFRQGINYLEWILYMSTLVFMFDFLLSSNVISFRQKWNAGAISVLLTWINLLLFLTRFPYFGLYVVMFVEVFATVLRVLIVFGVFIVAFALSFHSLLRELPTFKTVERSLMKVAVMTIGELEYDNVLTDNINANAASGLPKVPMQGVTYIVYSIFLLLMPIILMNLLVGLAVGDIEAIRKTAYIRILQQQVDLLHAMELNYPNFIQRWAYKKELTEYPNKESTFGKLRRYLGYNDEYGYLKEEQDEQAGLEDEIYRKLNDNRAELAKQKKHIKQIKAIVKDQGILLRKIASKLEIIDSDEEDD